MFDQEVDYDVGIGEGCLVESVLGHDGVFEELVTADEISRVILQLGDQCLESGPVWFLLQVEDDIMIKP